MGAIMFDRTGNTNSETTTSVSAMMTKHDICDEAQVSLSYVNKILATGALPHLKLGRAVRIRRADWYAFLANSTARGS